MHTFGVGRAGVVAGAVGCLESVDGGGAYEGEGREGGFEGRHAATRWQISRRIVNECTPGYRDVFVTGKMSSC